MSLLKIRFYARDWRECMAPKKNFYLIFIVLFILSVMPSQVSNAEKGNDDVERFKSAITNDFLISVEIVKPALNVDSFGESKISIIEPKFANQIKIFRINRTGDTDVQKTYELFYFLDGRLDDYKQGIHLPYDFKQTYQGIEAGSHQVKFVVKDSEDKIGAASVSISVEH